MAGWTKLTDMELSDDEKLNCVQCNPVVDRPNYPYGLAITLESEQLKKLELDADCDVGDVIDLRAFAVVTSVEKNSTESGDRCCVRLQIQKLAVENETTEDMEEEDD